MGSSSAPVLLHLLADKTLKPAAALMVFNASDADVALDMVSHPEFAAFAAGFPCLVEAGLARSLPAGAWEALAAAGCQPVEASQVQRCDGALQPLAPGVAWVDGDWFLAPPARPKASQSASRVLALKLVELVNADADTREIEDVFRQDPTLSYHLLRLVNSLAFGANRKITSFSQAILMLGRQQLKRWLNLMLFAAGNEDPRAPMLLASVVVRARSMEVLTRETGGDKAAQDLAFMAGMFSLLGTLFGMPIADIFKPLQVAEELAQAVLHHHGALGELLRAVECAQAQDSAGVAAWLDAKGVAAADFSRFGWQACEWMRGVSQDAGHD